MKNRAACIVLTVVSAFVLVASAASARAETFQPRVAMLLWRGMTRAEDGFIDRLSVLDVDVRLTVFDARQDMSRLNTFLTEKFRPEDYDCVYTFGTTVSVRVADMLEDRVPQIFNIVAYPVRAGLVESMGGSGRSLCGVSNSVSMSGQLDYARTMVQFRTLGVLFTPEEKNAREAASVLESLAEGRGIRIVRFPAARGEGALSDALSAVAAKEAGIDAVYLPTESRIASRGEQVGRALEAAGVPSIAAVESLVRDGALLGLVPNYYDLGRQAADIFHAHLTGGNLAEMPVERPQTPRPVLNMETARAMDVEVPPSIRKEAFIYD